MRHRTKWGKKHNEGLTIVNVSDKDRLALNVTETFIQCQEAHFVLCLIMKGEKGHN